MLFGQELPQHTQQAGIIDAAVDVVKVVQGKFEKVAAVKSESLDLVL